MGLLHGDEGANWTWAYTVRDDGFRAPPGAALLVTPDNSNARTAKRCKPGDVVGERVVVNFRPGIWTIGPWDHVFDRKSAALPHYLNGEALDMALEVWGFCAWSRGEADAGTVAWDVNEKGEAVNIRFFDHVKRAGMSKCEPAGVVRCAC